MRKRTKRIVGSFLIFVATLSGQSAFSQETSPEDKWEVSPQKTQKQNPIPANEESLIRGKEFYARECLDCHGALGHGDGPGAQDLKKKMPDISNPEIQAQTDGSLFWKIKMGRTPMPAYRDLLKDEEIWDVVNYVRTLTRKK